MSETFTGHRLDRWLKRTDPYKGLNLSQAHIEKLLRQKKILVNGQKATASTRITEQDQVTLAKGLSLDFLRIPERPIPKTKAFVYSQEDIQFLSTLILWEDEEICVLNKPSGLAVQGGTGTTKHLDGLLQAYGRGQPFRLVHRLDKDTSGVLVVAKTLEKSIELAKAFQKGNIEKTYWALVEGLPKPAYGTIKASLSKDFEESFEKMKVDPKKGKTAVTHYRLIKALGKKGAWVELQPQTGRTHQLRVHCSHIGHPIIGDVKYGAQKSSSGLCLHARSLKIPDISTGRGITFTAPPPSHIQDILKSFKVNWDLYT